MARHQSLASEFPASDEGAWRALVDGTFAERGGSRTDDGLAIAPVYPREPAGRLLWTRPGNGQWTIVQRIAADGIDVAVEQLSADITGGAGAVELAFRDSAHPFSGRLSATAAPDLAKRTEIPRDIAIRIDAGEETTNVADAFVGHFDGAATRLSLALDPIALLGARGRLGRSIGDLVAGAAVSARRWNGSDIATVLVADGRIWHAAGASEVQELAAVLASFVVYLRSLEVSGCARDWAAERIGLVLAADADQLLTIAKFRAMRLLHARVRELAGLPAEPCRIHAETAWRMMSRREARINLLRTSVAAFAAAVGGADSIAVLPYDLSDNADSTQPRRLARNAQLILASESSVGAAGDPGAGSGAVENLSDALAAAAWTMFREIEAEGGIAASVRSGAMQRRVAVTRQERLARVARGESVLIGVNAFVADDEPNANPLPSPPVKQSHVAETAEPLVFTRLSEPFESDDPPSFGRRGES